MSYFTPFRRNLVSRDVHIAIPCMAGSTVLAVVIAYPSGWATVTIAGGTVVVVNALTWVVLAGLPEEVARPQRRLADLEMQPISPRLTVDTNAPVEEDIIRIYLDPDLVDTVGERDNDGFA